MKRIANWLLAAAGVAVLILIILIVDRNTPVPERPETTPRAASRPTARPASTPREPRVGMYAGSSVTDLWECHGEDNTTVRDNNGNRIKTTKYCCDTDSRSYTVWVDKYGVVVLFRFSEKGAPSSSGGGKRKSPAPTPDVSDFVDPEDFYDWYRDDFSDFEEAEDYYYGHGGK